MPYLLLLASAEAISVISSQPNHLMYAFCHQAKPIHAESALIHVVNSSLLLFSQTMSLHCNSKLVNTSTSKIPLYIGERRFKFVSSSYFIHSWVECVSSLKFFSNCTISLGEELLRTTEYLLSFSLL
jgi:hypothetical protein